MLEGLEKFDADVGAWFVAVERAVSEVAVGLAHHSFEEILEFSPQNSGDFVANTRVSMTGKADTSFDAFVLGNRASDPYQMGDEPAQVHARSLVTWTPPKLGTPILISSTARHDEYYSWMIEKNEIKLRPENEGAFAVYRRAAASLSHRYTTIGKVQFEILRKVGV